jgi:hypothetical protein
MRRAQFLVKVTLLLVAMSRDAIAQVPPHYPGTICFTPQFWCWMPQVGPVGALCYCPSPYGWVAGRLG